MYSSRITNAAGSAIVNYENFFPAAYHFFERICSDDLPEFWISTDKNVHIYFNNLLIAYVVLHTNELEFVARRNGQMDRTCVDVTKDLLDEATKNIARKHGLIAKNFVVFDRLAKMNVKRQTPETFFDDLLDYWKTKYSNMNV